MKRWWRIFSPIVCCAAFRNGERFGSGKSEVAVAFSATALLWLATRWRLSGERGASALMRVQIGLGVVPPL